MSNIYKLFGLFRNYRKIFINIYLIKHMDTYAKLGEFFSSLIKRIIEEEEGKTRTEMMIEEYILDIPRPIKKRDKNGKEYGVQAYMWKE